jgi:hypothetical protein
LREGGRGQPAARVHFVEQLPRGAGVGDESVAVEERGVGRGVGGHAHAEVEAVREEDGDRRRRMVVVGAAAAAAQEREEAVVVGQGRDERGGLDEAEREERRAGAEEEAAQERVGRARVEAGAGRGGGGEEEEGDAAVRLGGAARRSEVVDQAEQGRQWRIHGSHRRRPLTSRLGQHSLMPPTSGLPAGRRPSSSVVNSVHSNLSPGRRYNPKWRPTGQNDQVTTLSLVSWARPNTQVNRQAVGRKKSIPQPSSIGAIRLSTPTTKPGIGHPQTIKTVQFSPLHGFVGGFRQRGATSSCPRVQIFTHNPLNFYSPRRKVLLFFYL